MCKHFILVVAWVVAGVICTSRAQAGLVVNLDFDDFSVGAPADGSTTLGGATLVEAKSVIQAAANYWEAAFTNSSSSINWSSNIAGTLTQNIAVKWASHAGSTLATGGTSWFHSDGRWGSGELTWDNDGSSQFFVDTTPGESSEWRQFSERDQSFSGVDVNVERVHYDAPAGTTRDNTDMLTVAIHEIGHALGFLDAFPAYEASDLDSDSDLDITSGEFAGAEIPINGGHTDVQIPTPAGGDFPYDPEPGLIFPQSDYYPNVMGPSIVTGTRLSLTEADIAIAAEFLEFDMSTVDFSPSLTATAVPEPHSVAFLAVGLAWVARRQRNLSRRKRL